jgi:hypothetical protein
MNGPFSVSDGIALFMMYEKRSPPGLSLSISKLIACALIGTSSGFALMVSLYDLIKAKPALISSVMIGVSSNPLMN